MMDYFALLNEPRRPWLDADSLKKKFLTLSASTHPDRVHAATPEEKATANKQFAELNTAYNCLREPKDRLRHLLELELGAKPKDLQEIPPDLADLFLEVARLRQETRSFLAERTKADSPMLQLQFFERSHGWIERLQQMQRRLNEQQSTILATLRVLNSEWQRTETKSPERARFLPRLEEIWRLLSFYSRWSSQLQEAIVQLAL